MGDEFSISIPLFWKGKLSRAPYTLCCFLCCYYTAQPAHDTHNTLVVMFRSLLIIVAMVPSQGFLAPCTNLRPVGIANNCEVSFKSRGLWSVFSCDMMFVRGSCCVIPLLLFLRFAHA